jgi:hypothetical protein
LKRSGNSNANRDWFAFTVNAEFRAAIKRREYKFAADFFTPNRHEIVNGSTILSRARVAPMS